MQDVFIICPKTDSKRRRMLAERFEAVGCRAHFVDAMMGAELSDAEKRPFLESDRQFYSKMPFHNNEIGCAMSHYKIWQMIATGDADVGFVFEDDAIPLTEDMAYMQSIMGTLAQMGQRLDLVMLHQYRSQRKKIPIHALDDGTHLSLMRFQDMLALSYMISKSAAQALLKHPNRYRLNVDVFLHKWWRHQRVVLCLDPPLFAPDGRDSLIGYDHREQWARDGWHHKMARLVQRWRDTIAKRMCFGAYVRKVRGRFN